MRLLITGSKGQLGSELNTLRRSFSGYKFFFTSREDLNICNKSEVDKFIATNKITNIINCAAYTAVDKAETEPELANKVNNLAVGVLAEVAEKYKLQLIHISTDYVFNGQHFKPYTELDSTSPINVYGRTKLDGEKMLYKINPDNSVILRTSWVYSSFGNNFVKTMLKLGEEKQVLNVVNDQIGTPTYARDLAKFILQYCLKKEHQGVETIHFTNEGVCSWYDFAVEVMELGKRDCKVNPIPSSEFPTPAQRPFFSLLDKSKLKKEFDYSGIYWKQSLRHCIQKTKGNPCHLS